jgi:hypothetical protein
MHPDGNNPYYTVLMSNGNEKLGNDKKNMNDNNSKKRNPSYDLAKLAEERAERMRKLSNPPTVVPFSGHGRRVDGKKTPGKKSDNNIVQNFISMQKDTNSLQFIVSIAKAASPSSSSAA